MTLLALVLMILLEVGATVLLLRRLRESEQRVESYLLEFRGYFQTLTNLEERRRELLGSIATGDGRQALRDRLKARMGGE